MDFFYLLIDSNFVVQQLPIKMINFNNIFNLRSTNKIDSDNKKELIRAKIEFRIIASDVAFNEINKLLVFYTDQDNNIKTAYNIPSLIFINFDYLDLLKPCVLFIFSNQPEVTSVRMFINDSEVEIDKYNIVVKVIPFNLLNEYVDKSTIELNKNTKPF